MKNWMTRIFTLMIVKSSHNYFINHLNLLKMQKKVEILTDDMGNVVRLSKNNPDYGFIRLSYKDSAIGTNGWLKSRNLTTLILGETENLTAYVKGLGKDLRLAGKIVVKESLEPFNESDPDRDLKYAGDTGIICCLDGQPIYRKTEYTYDENATDVLVKHNNGDAIRAANAALDTKVEAATTAQAFGINTEETTEEAEEAPEVADEIEDTTSDEVVDEVEEEFEEETFEL
jgi:hypothetical protein